MSTHVEVSLCADCGSVDKDRSTCPFCKKVLCRDCAEKPYAFCCDSEFPNYKTLEG